MRSSLRHLVFPLLVLTGLAAAGYLAASVRVPGPVPDYSLQAAAVYRLEVGAAFFALLYLAAMTFLLALDGRGFVEFGTQGFKAERVVRVLDEEQEEAVAEQMKLIRSMGQDLEEAEVELRKAVRDVRRLGWLPSEPGKER
jgi:hypothetical protein